MNRPSIHLDPLPVYKSGRRLYSAFVYSNDLVITGGGGVELVALTNVATGPGQLYLDAAAFGIASPDGRWMIKRSEWENALGVNEMPLPHYYKGIVTGADVMNVAFTPRGDQLAVATRAGLEFYDATTWERAGLLPMPMDRYASLMFAPDGRGLWVSRDSRSAGLYDRRTLNEVLPMPTGTLPLALSPDGRNLAVSVEARRLQVWDLVELRRQFRDLGVLGKSVHKGSGR